MLRVVVAVVMALPAALQAREAVVISFDTRPQGGEQIVPTMFVLNSVGIATPARSSREGKSDSDRLSASYQLSDGTSQVLGYSGLVDASAEDGPSPDAASIDPCFGRLAPTAVQSLSRDAARRRELFWPLVAASECRHGLPAGLFDALVIQESRYLPGVTSHAGALGLAQLMPGTARELGVFDRLDPAANVDGGARYLRAMLDRFKSVPLALAAYNAGPGAVMAARGIPGNRETPGYVARVLNYWTATWNDPQQSLRASAQRLGFAPTEGS